MRDDHYEDAQRYAADQDQRCRECQILLNSRKEFNDRQNKLKDELRGLQAETDRLRRIMFAEGKRWQAYYAGQGNASEAAHWAEFAAKSGFTEGQK